MLTTTLGANGPQVSRFGLGTMSLTASQTPDEGREMVTQAIDAGITLIDTADVYGNGQVEEVLGAALKGRRDSVVLATKVGLPMDGDTTRSGGSKRWITTAIDDSLRRLQTDFLDLYQLHRPDPATPIDETVEAFDELIKVGKIRYSGSSVFAAEAIVESQWSAERLAAHPFVSEQSPYSIFVRGIERSVLPTARRFGVGVLAWSPLNGGWLTGKYRRGLPVPAGSRAASGNPFVRADDDRKLDLVDRLTSVADQAGISLLQLSLAWTLTHPVVSSVLLGPRTLDQLTDMLGADGLVLSDDILDAIDEIVPPGTDVDPRNSGSSPLGLAVDQRR
jgi:aryl-alcohol dehydrogenase-like predicted oxidoreductase